MTKRFELVWTDTGEVLHDNETGLNKGIYSPDYRFHVRDMMNELAEENEQLRLQLNLCSDQRNEFHRGARENANCIGKLEKENEQLKKILGFLENDNTEDILNVLNSQENKIWELKQENEQLKQFRDRVFELIDEKIKRETYSAEMIEKTIEGEYNLAVNRLTIAVLEELKKELKE